MATSNSNNETSKLTTPSPHSNNNAEDLDKTPCLPPLEKPPAQTKVPSTTIHEFCIKLTLTVPQNEAVPARSKFATFLSILIQQFPLLTMETWDAAQHGRSNTADEDLPHEKRHLKCSACMNSISHNCPLNGGSQVTHGSTTLRTMLP
eukprot:9596653-Ditylum_brightwellii.AAC.1